MGSDESAEVNATCRVLIHTICWHEPEASDRGRAEGGQWGTRVWRKCSGASSQSITQGYAPTARTSWMKWVNWPVAGGSPWWRGSQPQMGGSSPGLGFPNAAGRGPARVREDWNRAVKKGQKIGRLVSIVNKFSL